MSVHVLLEASLQYLKQLFAFLFRAENMLFELVVVKE